jgi:hypothetical protein
MLNNPLLPKGGALRIPELPGFGMEVKPEVWTGPAAIARATTAQVQRARKSASPLNRDTEGLRHY